MDAQAPDNRSQKPYLAGVYNAEGGLVGEMTYLVKKFRGTTHCALCTITHGPNPVLHPTGTKEWKRVSCGLSLEMKLFHLNEMPSEVAALVSRENAPAVVLVGTGYASKEEAAAAQTGKQRAQAATEPCDEACACANDPCTSPKETAYNCVIATREELEACDGDPNKLDDLIRQKLERFF